MKAKRTVLVAIAALMTLLLASNASALLYYNRGPAIDYSGFFGPQGQRPIGIYTRTGYPLSNTRGSFGYRPHATRGYGFWGVYYLYDDGAHVSVFDRYRASYAARTNLPVRIGNTYYEPPGSGGWYPRAGCSYWC